MQKLRMFTVFDSKANAYIQPFFSRNADTATREFDAAVNKKGAFNQFAEDYSLFELGEFDQDEGTFEIHKAPVHIINAVNLLDSTFDEPGYGRSMAQRNPEPPLIDPTQPATQQVVDLMRHKKDN